VASCFVIMGFGEKTDFQSNPQRVLNLNRTYEDIIKPAVTGAGHTCVRADEIIHSTVIDKPMYDNLLEADLVVADLSTSNANAIYELGVRHALRPHRTIVMAENNFSFPFDLNHLSILKYEHLGKDIGYQEVMRVRGILQAKITALMNVSDVDSPVFLFIPTLRGSQVVQARNATAEAFSAPAPSSDPTDHRSFAELLVRLRAANASVQTAADWKAPLDLLNRLRTMQPDDPYILQQLALATYKYEQPDKTASLVAAKQILARLAPQTSSDAETVGIWGAIHKRLWDQLHMRADLDEAITAYARGYYIKSDYYNGINYAYMLDIRASSAAGDDAVADRVLARRVRQDVLAICDRLLQAAPPDAPEKSTHPDPGAGSDQPFWIGATKVEALFGLGRRDEASLFQSEIIAKERERRRRADPAGDAASEELNWKEGTLSQQLETLRRLLPT
jgi:MAP3K TRAFs-binding domain